MRVLTAFIVVATIAILSMASPATASNPPRDDRAIEVGILLFDGVQIIDMAAPYEVFGQVGMGVSTVSRDGAALTTAMGLRVTPDFAFDTAPRFDVLLVPGGYTEVAEHDESLLTFVNEQAATAKHVLSICTGSHIVAAAGLLDGLPATTFHRALGHLRVQYPKVQVVQNVRWVDNGKIITSAGLTSGLDASLHLVARLFGEQRAKATALHLEYNWIQDDGFVRTKMADRHLPDLAAIGWPPDMKAERIIAVGDEDHWIESYRVHTTLPQQQLLNAIDMHLAGTGEWLPVNGDTGQWWRLSENAPVLLAIDATMGPARTQTLRFVVEVGPSHQSE